MRNIRDFMGGLGNRLFQFGFLYSQVREGNLPDIYLQDYTRFDRYKEELKKEFDNLWNNSKDIIQEWNEIKGNER